MPNLPKTFSTYLKIKGFSPTTIRNYRCDLNHFLGWLILFLKGKNLPVFEDENKLIEYYFTANFLAAYKDYLLTNGLPISTINRRLSTLRIFSVFCQDQRLISHDPTRELTNANLVKNQTEIDHEEDILIKFKSFLEAEKNSSNTIRNYLSDIREFIYFLGLST